MVLKKLQNTQDKQAAKTQCMSVKLNSILMQYAEL